MYSIIYESKIIDVVQNPTFIKVLLSGHVAFTDKASANGILGSDNKTIYAFEPVNYKNAKVVSMEEISEEEFSKLRGLLNSGYEITADRLALTSAIAEAILKLSEICNSKIIEGFSIRLSDNEKHNFRLTTEDQLNLLNLENQLNSGAYTFVYHATGEPCKIFTREEVVKIVKAYRRHVLYHTTYFNIAKQYINSLVDIDKVVEFTYGMDVSKATDNEVIEQILKNGGNLW